MRYHVRILLFAMIGAFALMLANPGNADAQFGKIGDKVKKKVEKKADQETDKAIDKTVDDGFDKAGDVVTGSGESSGNDPAEEDSHPTETVPSQDPSPAVSAPSSVAGGSSNSQITKMRPGEGAWLNYDFVPGDQVIYTEDFSTTPVGDYPRRIEFVEGNMEVAEWNGKEYFRVSEDGKFEVPLPANLPEEFTIEAEVFLPKGTSLYIYEGTTGPKKPWSKTHNVRYRKSLNEEIEGGLSLGSGKWLTTEDVGKHTDFINVRIMLSGRYLKAYANEIRLANVPNAEWARCDRIMFHVQKHTSRSGEGMLFGNIRVAEGGKKFLYDELEASGRVATQGIYFDVNSDNIRPESTPTLKEIGTMLQNHPELRLLIEGHTDSQGDDAHNMELSQKRAAAVKAYICGEYDVDQSRLDTQGLGESKPVEGNDTPEGRQNNRRVELVKLS